MSGFFSKIDGFLAAGKLKRYKPLPPRLQIEFDPPKAKEKKKEKVVALSRTPQVLLDVECFWNYFLVKFTRVSDGAIFDFEQTDYLRLEHEKLKSFLMRHEIVTFNGNIYDILIVRLALTGANCEELKQATNEIIQEDLTPYKFEKRYKLPKMDIKHIDIIGLLPGVGISLKIYGGRLHCTKMQDLPYHEDDELTEDEMDNVNEYCGNDLEVTGLALDELLEQIELRRVMSKKYGLDLLSKSDAQIAEEVIKSELSKLKGVQLKRPDISELSFYYTAPDFIQFVNPDLLAALDIMENEPFEVGMNGKVKMPKALADLKIKIGTSTYKMGMGGLHSMEKRAFHLSDERYIIEDWDVDGYYPEIILRCGLYPKRLGKEFLEVYRTLVVERLKAKSLGDVIKSGSLKIVVNGSFGKLGSPYSVLYAPELMIQVTVTGQLSLLMLIDMMERAGIHIVSGNTDGIVIKCPRDKEAKMHSILKYWQKVTRFKMSQTKYAGIWSRDINNYIAIKYDGSVKMKGCFSPSGLSKNPENEICTLAMIEYLKHGTHFEETIRACKDVRKFVTVRAVGNGGAFKNDFHLGKAIRWYHAAGEKGCIVNGKGEKVPMTDGVKPIMDLSVGFPKDIDYEWYVNKCKELF